MSDAETVDVSVEKYGDINVIAGALKSFFRSLPEPLMSYELYDDFINAIGKQDIYSILYIVYKYKYKLSHSGNMLYRRNIRL